MNGRELSEKLNYLGMERSIRELALDDKFDTVENIAKMSTVEICNLIASKYIVLSESSDELLLLEKCIYAKISKDIKRICR